MKLYSIKLKDLYYTYKLYPFTYITHIPIHMDPIHRSQLEQYKHVNLYRLHHIPTHTHNHAPNHTPNHTPPTSTHQTIPQPSSTPQTTPPPTPLITPPPTPPPSPTPKPHPNPLTLPQARQWCLLFENIPKETPHNIHIEVS